VKKQPRRELSWLQEHCVSLQHIDINTRKELISIAGKQLPAPTAESATLHLRKLKSEIGSSITELVRATRWLSMIRRDYGEEKFLETVNEINGMNNNRPKLKAGDKKKGSKR